MPTQTRRKPTKRAPGIEIDETVARSRPQLVALLFCDLVNVTKEGKHNLIGVFDTVTIAADETLTPVFTLFIRVAHAVDEPLQLRVFGPDDELAVQGSITLPDMASRSDPRGPVQLVAHLQFEPKLSGAYWFEVVYGEQSLGGADLLITLPPAEEQTVNVTGN